MTTLKELRQKASEFGGTVVFGNYNPYDQSTSVEVEAPDGKQWVDGNCQVLLGFFFSYIKGSRFEAYNQLIERIGYGLEDFIE